MCEILNRAFKKAKEESYKPKQYAKWVGTRFEDLACHRYITKTFTCGFGEWIVTELTKGKLVRKPGYDVVKPDGTKIEVKTSKAGDSSYKVNQIYLQKPWEELWIVSYSPTLVSVHKATKLQLSGDNWKELENRDDIKNFHVNNGMFITWRNNQKCPLDLVKEWKI